MSIPRKIFQLWVGEKKLPDREKEWSAQMAAMNPTWKHALLGNELFDRYAADPYLRYMRAKGERIAYITDRLRVLLLRDEGGVYVDVDAQPLKPLDSLPIWDWPHVDFVYGTRNPGRKDVALWRGVPIVDNTFLASAPNGRMIGYIDSLWTAAQITGQDHAVNGHRTGIAIQTNHDHTCVGLNYRYIYCEESHPESLILHDSCNMESWVPEHLRRHNFAPK